MSDNGDKQSIYKTLFCGVALKLIWSMAGTIATLLSLAYFDIKSDIAAVETNRKDGHDKIMEKIDELDGKIDHGVFIDGGTLSDVANLKEQFKDHKREGHRP